MANTSRRIYKHINDHTEFNGRTCSEEEQISIVQRVIDNYILTYGASIDDTCILVFIYNVIIDIKYLQTQKIDNKQLIPDSINIDLIDVKSNNYDNLFLILYQLPTNTLYYLIGTIICNSDLTPVNILIDQYIEKYNIAEKKYKDIELDLIELHLSESHLIDDIRLHLLKNIELYLIKNILIPIGNKNEYDFEINKYNIYSILPNLSDSYIYILIGHVNCLKL